MIQHQLRKRVRKNAERLLGDLYSYPGVFEQPSAWPGDFPGRAILALASLYHALSGDEIVQKEILSHLQAIFDHLPEYTNADGYFGEPFDPERINEQQLSGNGWYLRGLCEYVAITHDEKTLKMIQNIQEKFLLPLCPCYASYPSKSRAKEGGVAGHLLEDSDGRWLLSSDVGCAFIMLDGIVAVYELLRDPRLKKGIEDIIAAYQKIDYLSLKCQTHATLTTCRAILRFYKATGNEKCLLLGQKIFADYCQHGMSLDYENMNWFGRPDSWTEPCAVIDSWIVAKALFDLTGESHYLRLYNRIVLNGLRTFQRDNGGAGCSLVATKEQPLLKSFMYEAYFCCSMRLGEGMRVVADNIKVEKDGYLLYLPIDEENEAFSLRLEGESLHVEFHANASLRLYLPEGVEIQGQPKENGFVSLGGEAGQSLLLPLRVNEHVEDGLHYLGDLLLSKKECEGASYSLLYRSMDYEEAALAGLEQRLF